MQFVFNVIQVCIFLKNIIFTGTNILYIIDFKVYIAATIQLNFVNNENTYSDKHWVFGLLKNKAQFFEFCGKPMNTHNICHFCKHL